jgi:hypothetical protein
MRLLWPVALMAAGACATFDSGGDASGMRGAAAGVDDAAAADGAAPESDGAAPESDGAAPKPVTSWVDDHFDKACSGWIPTLATVVWVDAGGIGGGGACMACFQAGTATDFPGVDRSVGEVDAGVGIYEADAWVRLADAGASGTARLIAFSRKADGGQTSNVVNKVTLGADWQLLQVVTPALDEPVARIDLRLQAPSTCIYLDDLRVFPQP